MKDTHLPYGCGSALNDVLLFNPWQQKFQSARRMRFCLNCKKMGSMDENSVFVCQKCQRKHENNLTAPRAFNRFLVLSGRGGGKTLIGAHAAREEALIPNSIGWVLGPTYKILHDSTFPTFMSLINPQWVAKWDKEHMELRLKNGALVAFRSLEDPERARGPHGVGWGWFDEAAQCPHRAYHVFEPTLTKAGGIIIATTTVYGYDWTYEEIERRALVYKEPGYWACRYHTEHNPLFQANPVMRQAIERARRTMPPELFAQEYQAERRNATGLIYGHAVEKQYLPTDDAVKQFIPEWPRISPSRKVIIGLDSGADHPFGAAMLVVTERGIIVVADYLERQRALATHHGAITAQFNTRFLQDLTWAANKNEAQLRLEFGLLGTGVVPAESKHEVGIQRVQSWLHSSQLYIAYTAQRTYEQMKAYRYAENTKASGEKTEKERVFKLKDELPDAVRYALMAFPELPKELVEKMTDEEQRRWDTMDESTRQQILRSREYRDRTMKEPVLQPDDEGYPLGDFNQHDGGGNDDYSIMW